MLHPVLSAAQAALTFPLACTGDQSLLDLPRRALLISRTPRQPQPQTPWVRKLLASAHAVHACGEVLVTGTERLPYDLVLRHARRSRPGIPAIVALASAPSENAHAQTCFPSHCLLVWPDIASRKPVAPSLRDQLMGALADRAYVIQARPNGIMTGLAQSIASRNGRVELWPDPPPLSPATGRVLPASAEYRAVPPPSPWEFLTHFTRAPDGAWPGEPLSSYLDWLGNSLSGEPRDSFAALCRILDEKQIRASGTFIPGKRRAACFTAVPPHEASRLRRWHRGLRRWSVSLYGLGIRRTVLEQYGARPIQYVSGEILKKAAPAGRMFMQIKQSAAANWSAEAEWRIPCSIDLTRIAPGDLCALVSCPGEAAHIARRYGIAAHVL